MISIFSVSSILSFSVDSILSLISIPLLPGIIAVFAVFSIFSVPAVAISAQRSTVAEGLYAVEHHSQDISILSPESIQSVVDIRGKNIILTHYQQDLIRIPGKNLCVSQDSRRRRIDDHIIRIFSAGIHQAAKLGPLKDLRRGRVTVSSADKQHIGIFDLFQYILKIRILFQKFSQLAFVLHLQSKDQELGRSL